MSQHSEMGLPRRPDVRRPKNRRTSIPTSSPMEEEISNWYTLKGKTPVPASPKESAAGRGENDRIVARDVVGKVLISTVFLGLDHSFGNSGPPILFETMVFPNHVKHLHETHCQRYATWDEAEAGHYEVPFDVLDTNKYLTEEPL